MIVKARYTPRILPEYKDHPFVEALRDRLTWPDFLARFKQSHQISEADRQRPASERIQLLDGIHNFFVGMARQFELDSFLLSRMERSYVTRNPCNPDYWVGVKQKRVKVVNAAVKCKLPPERGRTAAALVGAPGSGKTAFIKRDLSTYDDAIKHGIYNGRRLGCIQIPTVLIEVDKNTTTKGVCDQILNAADRKIGTTYGRMYRRQSENEKMAGVVTVCHNHGIGLLVVDELQELSLKKTQGETAVLSFMLNLANCAGPFVLFVGTPTTRLLRSSAFHHIRRQSSVPPWNPFARDSGDWRDFLNELWRCQLVKTPVALDPLRDAVFDITRGIPDLAIELYAHAQRKLILHEGPDNKEEITESYLRVIASTYMKREMDAIAAYDKLAAAARSGSQQDLELAMRDAHGIPLDLPSLPSSNVIQMGSPKTAPRGPASKRASGPESERQAELDGVVLSLLEIAKGESTREAMVAKLREIGMTKSAMELLQASDER
jgi:hypothetical protein